MGVGDDVEVYRNTVEALGGGGGVYVPDIKANRGSDFNKSVHYLANKRGGTAAQRATLAHELGHARNMRNPKVANALMKLRGLGKLGITAGGLGAGFLGDKDHARNAAMIGSGLGTAGFLEEGVATTRGIRGLQKYYGGGFKGLRKALKSGRGMIAGNLLSYGLMAGAPLMAYKARSALEGKDWKTNKQQNNLNNSGKK
jgi:hypothetical protein